MDIVHLSQDFLHKKFLSRLDFFQFILVLKANGTTSHWTKSANLGYNVA